MTADIRTAAQREAEGRFENRFLPDNEMRNKRSGFEDGAVWGAARVTPTREQIAEVIDEHAEVTDGINVYETADEILALMAGLAEGESDG